MRRALWLISVILTLILALGLWMDLSQQNVARTYLASVAQIRALTEEGKQEEALQEQRYLHALWQRDELRLNCLISHHHTRAVSAAMTELGDAISHRWEPETLQALNALEEALREVERSDFPYWENIL